MSAWQPSMSWQDAKLRAKILVSVRSFFSARDVIEVETPLFSNSTITDVHLDAFTTDYNYFSDSDINSSTTLYAQTSPEYAMKRLLAAGYGCCFQLCKAFRHEQHGHHHNPEFTMLEWYRLGFDHFQLMDELAEFLQEVLGCKSTERISYQALFLREVGIDPLNTTKAQLLKVIKEYGAFSDWLAADNNKDTLLQFIMAELIEPKVGKEVPCFVYNFPASQASLAKICTEDARVAERFECYFRGLELANGFNELTNAEQQVDRFKDDNNKRAELSMAQRPIDKNFIDALSHGLPTCAGVALGIDRLIMLALNRDSIEQVLSFPIDRA